MICCARCRALRSKLESPRLDAAESRFVLRQINNQGARDMMKTIVSRLLPWGSVLALTGCVSLQTSPHMPLTGEKVSVTAVSEPFGLNDVPVGTYRVPESAFAVRKYMEISTVAGAFGALGVLAAHSSGVDDSKASVGGV